MQKLIKNLTVIITLCFVLSNSYAAQNIQIVGGSIATNPTISLVNFTNDNLNNIAIIDIIANDLKVSGDLNVNQYQTTTSLPNNIQYLLTGVIESSTNGYRISYKLINNKESMVQPINQSIKFNIADIRLVAHTISNQIYQKITNIPGIFTTKIAYIAKKSNRYNLIVADYDGYNEKTLITSKYALTSLNWDQTGQQIAYVSFESGKPVIYVQNIYEKKRYILANFKGSNSSPQFIPNSEFIAATLTKNAGSHIFALANKPYLADVTSKELIHFGTIDTEASIGSNGNVIFTSNHDGGPQIFISNLQGAEPIRLTQNLGNYNTSAHLSHDFTKITFINRNDNGLKTYIQDLNTKISYPLSINTNLDLAPSFAPNDRLVLFSSNNSLYLVNITGTTQTKLINIQSDSIIDQSFANNF